jgi:flagellar hook assembly protein FlgD
MDANEFTSQLVEFASVEQAIQTDGLDGTGSRVPAGSYRVRVDAMRADGTALTAE